MSRLSCKGCPKNLIQAYQKRLRDLQINKIKSDIRNKLIQHHLTESKDCPPSDNRHKSQQIAMDLQNYQPIWPKAPCLLVDHNNLHSVGIFLNEMIQCFQKYEYGYVRKEQFLRVFTMDNVLKLLDVYDQTKNATGLRNIDNRILQFLSKCFFQIFSETYIHNTELKENLRLIYQRVQNIFHEAAKDIINQNSQNWQNYQNLQMKYASINTYLLNKIKMMDSKALLSNSYLMKYDMTYAKMILTFQRENDQKSLLQHRKEMQNLINIINFYIQNDVHEQLLKDIIRISELMCFLQKQIRILQEIDAQSMQFSGYLKSLLELSTQALSLILVEQDHNQLVSKLTNHDFWKYFIILGQISINSFLQGRIPFTMSDQICHLIYLMQKFRGNRIGNDLLVDLFLIRLLENPQLDDSLELLILEIIFKRVNDNPQIDITYLQIRYLQIGNENNIAYKYFWLNIFPVKNQIQYYE